MNKRNFIFAYTLLLVSSHTVLASATVFTDVSGAQTRSRIDHAGGGAGGRYSNSVDAIKTDTREEAAKHEAEKAEKEKREKENNKKDGKK